MTFLVLVSVPIPICCHCADPIHADPMTANPFVEHMNLKRPQLLKNSISLLFMKYHGTISAAIQREIDSVPAAVEAEGRRLYHQTDQPVTEANSDLGSSFTAMPSGHNPTSQRTAPDRATDNQQQLVQLDAIEATCSAALQVYPPTRATMSPRRHSLSTATYSAQQQQSQSLVGQPRDITNAQQTASLSPEYSFSHNHGILPQTAYSSSYGVNPSQSGPTPSMHWVHTQSPQFETIPPSWPTRSVPYLRPETTPPIASFSPYQPHANLNGPNFSTPPSSMSFFTGSPQNYQHSQATGGNPYGTSQFEQGPAMFQQFNPHKLQSPVQLHNPISARHQNQDPFTNLQPFNTTQSHNAQPYLVASQPGRSLRSHNPFISRIEEEVTHQTGGLNYQGCGQNMDQSP